MESPRVCSSHERIDDSINRQERILDSIRSENANHQLQITKVLAEVSEQLKTVGEIRGTLADHNRRRDDDKGNCEERRADMWDAINAVKTRQDKKDGSMVLVASVCTGTGAAMAWLLTWLQKHL